MDQLQQLLQQQQQQQQTSTQRPTDNNSNMLVDIKEFSAEDKNYPLANWLQNIKVAHRMNKWSIEETREYVLMRAIGKAGRKLRSLQQVDSIESLLQAIASALKDDTAVSTAVQDAMRNGQKKNETTQALGDRVRSMVFNWMGEPFNEKLAIEFFHGMLACKQTKFNLACNKKQINTLTDAINHAEDYQANLKAMFGNEGAASRVAGTSANFTAPALQHANGANVSTEDMDISAMNRFQGGSRGQAQTCYYCDKMGHIGTSCALLAKHKRLIANYEDRIRATTARGRGNPRFGRGANASGRGTFRGRGSGQRPYQRQFGRPMPRLQEMEELISKMREMEEEGVLDDIDFVDEEEQHADNADEGNDEALIDENQQQDFH